MMRDALFKRLEPELKEKFEWYFSRVRDKWVDPTKNNILWLHDTFNLIYHTTPHRGLEVLVPVIDFLANKGKKIHLDVYSSFKMYGWENRDEPYQKVFDKIKAHDNMTYHGYQPNDVIRKALKKAHMFSYPNIWPETSCIAMIEAMLSLIHI